jgi:hypothetical protein
MIHPHSAQSRQSAELFLQSSELGLPHPLTRRRVCSPLFWCAPPFGFGSGGGAHSLPGEGVGASQFQRGDRHCGYLDIRVYVCTLCHSDIIYCTNSVIQWISRGSRTVFCRSGSCSQVGKENPDLSHSFYQISL